MLLTWLIYNTVLILIFVFCHPKRVRKGQQWFMHAAVQNTQKCACKMVPSVLNIAHVAKLRTCMCARVCVCCGDFFGAGGLCWWGLVLAEAAVPRHIEAAWIKGCWADTEKICKIRLSEPGYLITPVLLFCPSVRLTPPSFLFVFLLISVEKAQTNVCWNLHWWWNSTKCFYLRAVLKYLCFTWVFLFIDTIYHGAPLCVTKWWGQKVCAETVCAVLGGIEWGPMSMHYIVKRNNWRNALNQVS